MNILYITTIGGTMNFFRTFIEELVQDGHVVDIACNDSVSKVPDFFYELGCKIHSVKMSRSPVNKCNLKAINQIKKLVKDKQYDIVHCHTPVAAAVTRLACRKLRKKDGLKVFYTAHGFKFHKRAPMKHWILFYPIEKLCARFTDKLITINKEDYALAKTKFYAKEVQYVHGVGVDLSKFENINVDRETKRKEIGVPEDAFLILSVGELSGRKNHQVIIKAMEKINDNKLHYIIAGEGEGKEYLLSLAEKLGVSDRVHLLGFRKDVIELNMVSDVFCFPSITEGLGIAALEAMACGLPIITSNVHGINDYSEDGITGYKCSPDDVDGFAEAIQRIKNNPETVERFSKYNRQAVKKYEISTVIDRMKEIYE